MSDHADHEYLLLTLQHVEAKLKAYPDHPTLRGQRDALIHAVDRAMPPAAKRQPSAFMLKAGPEAVALQERFSDVDKASDALGIEFSERPEIWNDTELRALAEAAESALASLSGAISTKLRKLCGVEP